MTIERFPPDRVTRIPVNLPFERVPSCAHDPGTGESFECTKCPTIKAVVADVCSADHHGCMFDKGLMQLAVEHLVSRGYDLQKPEPR